MAGHGGKMQTDEQYASPRHGKHSESKMAKARIELGLTQKQLADKLNMTAGGISCMERLESLSVRQAKKVAPVLGVNWVDLVK